jgi:glycine cleavage system transcriptional repressor
MKKVMITVIGPDRPGIISSVSGALYKQECNIENISQTTLQSEFAGICLVSLPAGLAIEALQSSMAMELADDNLHVSIKYLEDGKDKNDPPRTEPFIVSTCGPDRKGIVASISKIIAERGVNISNLKAVFEGGDNPDRNIMIFEIDVPFDVDLQSFSSDLRKMAESIGLDLNIQHKNIFDAVNRI